MNNSTLQSVTPMGINSIKLDTPYWFQWLEQCKSFRYVSSIAEYTCIKRSNGKWYAVKKQRGSRQNKQEYIGSDAKCTKAKLEAIARLFALPDKDYWYLKYPKPETGLKNTPTVGDKTQACTTIEQDTSQTVEIDNLKAEIHILRESLAAKELELELFRTMQTKQSIASGLIDEYLAKKGESQMPNTRNWVEMSRFRDWLRDS